MNTRFKILLLTCRNESTRRPVLDTDCHHFFPGGRAKTYLEVLTGYGIPFDVMDPAVLLRTDIIDGDFVRYSTVILAEPVSYLSGSVVGLLESVSRDSGVRLFTDTFMLSDKLLFEAFGLSVCSSADFRPQTITDNTGSELYRTRLRPFSPRGRDIGIRPILRLLLQSWRSRRVTLCEHASVIAMFATGRPAVVQSRFGLGVNVVLNVEPPRVLQYGNRFHDLIRRILCASTHCPATTVDLEGCVCLRMDDPGSAERVHLDGYNPGVLTQSAWQSLATALTARGARLSIAYIPWWVDDGDEERGALSVANKPVTNRVGGRTYPSHQITYLPADCRAEYDYAAQYQEIAIAVADGRFSIVAHGLTHLTTDLDAWCGATDRYTNLKWYREFREMRGGRSVDDDEMLDRMIQNRDCLEAVFGCPPGAIVPSAHEYRRTIPELARRAGYTLFSASATYILNADRDIIPNRKILACYPEDVDEGMRLIHCGYPVIFVFHDYDIQRNGVDWLNTFLDRFDAVGVHRYISIPELGYALSARLDVILHGSRLDIDISADEVSDRDQPPAGDIRIRIAAVVESMRINGVDCSDDLQVAAGITRISIPLTTLAAGAIRLEGIVSIAATPDVADGR